jgi:glycerate 2-kinase
VMACEAASHTAARIGFDSRVLTSSFTGEAREVGGAIGALAIAVQRLKDGRRKPTCLILGGESTVKVRGRGQGGRNQELALAAAVALRGVERTLVVSLGTDGVDGTTPVAGAYVTGQTMTDFEARGMDALRSLADNDSHTLLEAVGQTICTGPTGTNVGDIVFVLNYP